MYLIKIIFIFIICNIDFVQSLRTNCSIPTPLFNQIDDTSNISTSIVSGIMTNNAVQYGDNTYRDYNTINFGGTDFTFSFFLKLTQIEQYDRIMECKKSSSNDGYFLIRINTPATLEIFIFDSSSQMLLKEFYNVNVFVSYVVTIEFSTGEVKLYVNGTEVSGTITSGAGVSEGLISTVRNKCYMGIKVDLTSRHLDGILDEFFIYDSLFNNNYIQCISLDQCLPKCGTCQYDYTDCQTCEANRQNDPPTCTCITTPASNLYINASGNCSQCSVICVGCSLTSDQCDNCVSGRSSPPTCDCDAGTFSDTDLSCQSCSPICAECNNNATTCTVCASGRSSTPSCNCDPGTYSDASNICQSCSFICAECNTNATTCTVCNSGRSGTPICNCDDGTYSDASNICQNCSIKCTQCNNTADNCLTCANLRSEPPQCNCQTGYYEGQDQQCYQCSQNCQNCQGFSDNCTSCVDQLQSGQNCDCIGNTFKNSSNQCENCLSICLKCTNSSSNCIQCNNQATNPPQCNQCQNDYELNSQNICIVKEIQQEEMTTTEGQVLQAATTAVKTTKTTVETSFILFAAGGYFYLFVNLIDQTQLIYYMIFLDIVYPTNLMDFYNAFKFFQFPFIPNFFSLFYENVSEEQLKSLPGKYEEFGLTVFFMNNTGQSFSILIIMGLIWILFEILNIIVPKKMKKSRKFVQFKLNHQIKWNSFVEVPQELIDLNKDYDDQKGKGSSNLSQVSSNRSQNELQNNQLRNKKMIQSSQYQLGIPEMSDDTSERKQSTDTVQNKKNQLAKGPKKKYINKNKNKFQISKNLNINSDNYSTYNDINNSIQSPIFNQLLQDNSKDFSNQNSFKLDSIVGSPTQSRDPIINSEIPKKNKKFFDNEIQPVQIKVNGVLPQLRQRYTNSNQDTNNSNNNSINFQNSIFYQDQNNDSIFNNTPKSKVKKSNRKQQFLNNLNLKQNSELIQEDQDIQFFSPQNKRNLKDNKSPKLSRFNQY